tara:strand:- start:9040 stop:9648 length:609 start_codon:yes stop_codon:yes gene_type:complete
MIFWDLGNVLVTLDFDSLYGELCPLFGLSQQEIKTLLFPTGIFDRVNRGMTTPEEFHQEVLDALDKSAEDIPYNRFVDAWGSFFIPRPKMGTVLEQLAPHIPMWLLSNTDPLHHQRCQQMLPYLDHLTGQLTSYGLKALKPEALLYQRALEQTGYRPEQTVFFDDKQENIEGAKAMGMQAYLCTTADECIGLLKDIGLLPVT